MKLLKKPRFYLIVLGCLAALAAGLSASWPAGNKGHKFINVATSGDGSTSPSGSGPTEIGDKPFTNSHGQGFHLGRAPGGSVADSDPPFAGEYGAPENDPLGPNGGRGSRGEHGQSGSFSDGQGSGGGFGGAAGFEGGFGFFGSSPNANGNGTGQIQGTGTPGGSSVDGEPDDNSGQPGGGAVSVSLFAPETGPGNDETDPTSEPPPENSPDPGLGPDDFPLPNNDPAPGFVAPNGDSIAGQIPVQVPEPSSWSMAVLALLGMAFWRRRSVQQSPFGPSWGARLATLQLNSLKLLNGARAHRSRAIYRETLPLAILDDVEI